MRRRGLLVVLSGPAGSGKSTLAEDLIARSDDVCRAVTATTRSPRPGEKDGEDYYFLSHEEFEEGLSSGRFVEHNQFNGNFYGTPRDELERLVGEDKIVVLVIDVNGSREIRNAFSQAVHIFLLPPTPEVLRQRLAARGTESESDVEARLAIATNEIALIEHYDYLIINDDRAAAVDDLETIVKLLRTHHVRGGEKEAWADGAYKGWH